MNNNLKEKIIIPAWNTIKNDSKVKKYYIIPGLLSIIFLTFLLVYQVIYTYVNIIGAEREVLEKILKFFEYDYAFWSIIAFAIFIIAYFILIPIFEWWLIKYIDLKNKSQDVSWTDAFWQWILNFLPIFKYSNLFSQFKIVSILNFYLFTIRFIGLEYIKTINIIFLTFLIVWFIINIIFVYSKYAIIVNNKPVYQALWESSRITILNLKNTIKLYFLMLFLNVRVVLNFIIFLFFPVMIVVSIWLISLKFLMILAVWILSIIFIILIFIMWYVTAVLEVFKTSIWYYAYQEWRLKLEEEKNSEDSDNEK